MTSIHILILMLGIGIAAYCDARSRRIPNWLTFSMILGGIIVNIWVNGPSGLWTSGFGLIAGILLLYIPFCLGGLGGGDVKLLGAIGSIVGPYLVFQVFLASAIFGGFISIIEMIKTRTFLATLGRVRQKLVIACLSGKLPQEKLESSKKQASIPYAYAIGCGTLFVVFVLKGG